MACLTKSFHSQHLLREVAYAVNSDDVTLPSQSWGATSDGPASVANLVAHLASGPSRHRLYVAVPRLNVLAVFDEAAGTAYRLNPARSRAVAVEQWRDPSSF